MASPSPTPGAPRPPPGYGPPLSNPWQPNPNALAAPMQNLQIGSAPPPPGPNPPPPVAPSPFGGAFPGQSPISLPGPPTRPPGAPPSPFAQSQPPFGAPAAPPRPQAAGPVGSITSNGPSMLGPPGQRFPPPSSLQQQQPPAGSIRAPMHAAPQVQAARPFPGSPPPGAPLGTPSPQAFPGQVTPQPTGGLPPSQPFSGPPPMRPFAGPPQALQQPISVLPQQSLQPYSTNPASQQFFGPPPPQAFPGRPTAQTLPGLPPSPPFSAPPGSQPFSGPQQLPAFSAPPASQPSIEAFSRPPPTSASPYGASMWPPQPLQGPPAMPGSMPPPPRMYGMPPLPTNPAIGPIPSAMSHSPHAGVQGSSPSKIDPNQIPRPMPSTSVTHFETRQGNQASIPPPASSDYIVKDYGNCSPRLMRCTVNQIPCTGDILSTSSMPLALMVQPLALPHPSEDPIQVVDFGESGPLRCSRCKGYINPFMKFIDQGRRFICNLCGFTDETPRDYCCNLGPDGRRRDADERPELCRGTVEFVATKEYMVRDPMAPVFFFLIDVSMNAVQTGATAAACSAISQAIADLPEGPRTLVGVATFDSTIHFYNLRRTSQQPLMLIVPDVQDVYTPLHSDIIVQLTECRQHLEQLLESIPSMFEDNRIAESSFGAAVKAAFLAMKPTGGKLLVFQSVLPSVGIGSLAAREAEGRANVSSGDKEAHKLLQPMDKSLKTMAIEFAEYQVCVDVFLTTQTYVDIASISVVPRTTGGQVYYYHPFSALSDSAKLYNDLRWNVTRPQGFEAVMRVRCSQGLQVQEYYGSFCKRIPTDIDLPGIDCDKTIMVTFKHDDKFQEGTECSFQCALLYTTIYGQRRIRVTTLSLPCTSLLGNLFRAADLDTQFTCLLKQAANGIPSSSLSHVREQMMNFCINILHSYRKFCATVSSSGQLILPEALKLLPLYTLALVKSVGLRSDGHFDDRSYWVSRATSLSTPLAAPLVHPRMFSIHDLTTREADGSIIPPIIPLSSEHIADDGIYLLENGEDALIYVGGSVNTEILEQIFGAPSVNGISAQFVLQQYDNELSKRLNAVVNEMRLQRCSYLRFRLCRKGDPSGMLFFSYMVEDKTPNGLSYVEFLVHVHRQIQTKMT
uniref:Protein transport protein Sec24-like At4g32640 n=1 Tax=Anthurium amnicola TaxID=1678845 RepID=A0A1D1Z3K7_9ARAE